MTQETFVGRADPSRVRQMALRLEAEGMTSREVQSAIFSYAGNGLTVTLYNSGKLVVQGVGAEGYGSGLLGQAIRKAGHPPEEAVIGTDESGKGDYFGPLTVAAVFVSPRERTKMRAGEIDDSKKLSDTTIRRLAGAIQEKLPHAVLALPPTEYNRRYREVGNLNKLLAELHGQAILEVAKKVRCRRVLTDQFGDESLVRLALGKEAKRFDLRQRPRAEGDPAVAAASILAREAFVRGMRALEGEYAVDLPLGAGEDVERAALRFLEIHGRGKLGHVAKLHFKTTQKIERGEI